MTGDMYEPADEAVRPEILETFRATWTWIAAPGAWWDGAERVEIASAARAARETAGTPVHHDALPPATVEAVAMIAASPAAVTEAWVTRICDTIGEPRYVELVGIVAVVSAIDTFYRLTGRPLSPLPQAQPGEPSREAAPEGLRRNRTWVRMVMPVPPFVLGAVPSVMAAMNDLSDVLYMPHGEMGDPDWRRRDLHRTQIELVAASTSHVNECFY